MPGFSMTVEKQTTYARVAYDPTRRPPERLLLPAGLRREIIEHLRKSLPFEGCGLLAVDDSGLARHFYPGENLDRSPVRFTMDPATVIAAFKAMDAAGWVLGAIVHSHPQTPATPSKTDLREAHYPSALMMIGSFGIEPPDFRLWAVEALPGGGGVNAGERELIHD